MTFKRLPNGFGNISHLSGKRRRPFVARKNGVIVGTFATWDEAHSALARIIDTEVKKREVSYFADCYKAYVKERYTDDPEQNTEAKKKCHSAFNYCKPLWGLKMAQITVFDLESIRDNPELPRTVKGRVKMLLDGMFSYALRHDLIETNVQSKVLWKVDNSTKLERKMLTSEEARELIFEAEDSEVRDAVMVLIHTGLRPDELCQIKTENVDLEKRRIIGGSKTEAGKNRSIPISNAIKSIVKKYVEKGEEKLFSFGTYKTLRVKYLEQMPKLAARSFLYDFRHLFQTQCRECGVDEHVTDLIVGHKSKSLTLDVYTHVGWNYVLEQFDKFYYFKEDRPTIKGIRQDGGTDTWYVL